MKEIFSNDPFEQLQLFRDIVFDGNDFVICIGKQMMSIPSKFNKCNDILKNKIPLNGKIGYGTWLPKNVYSLESDILSLNKQNENILNAYENNENFRKCFLCVVFSGNKSYHVILKNRINIQDIDFYNYSFTMLPDCDNYFLARKIARVAGCFRNGILQNLKYVTNI